MRLRDAAQAAEELGFDSLWAFDHLWPLGVSKGKPVLECWSTLAYVAGMTARIGIGSLVTRSSLRRPAVLARMVATVGEVAPGRLTVGIGSGDSLSRAENEAFGLPYALGKARMDQLVATAEVLSAGPAHGARLWVGGRSRAVWEVAGRYGDGYNRWGGTPERFREAARFVSEAAGTRAVELSWGVSVLLAATAAEARARLGKRNPEEFVAGDAEGVAHRLTRFTDAGANHLVLRLPDAGAKTFERLASVAAVVCSGQEGRA